MSPRWCLLTALTVVLPSSCARSPDDGVAEATTAFEEAVVAEAGRYNPDALALASDALEAALAEVERQNDKVMPLRDYTRAHALLRQARQLARGARYEAVARRDQARGEAATILEVATREVGALEQRAPASPSEWGSWIQRFRDATGSLTKARLAFREGDYASARAEALRLVEELRETNAPGDSS